MSRVLLRALAILLLLPAFLFALAPHPFAHAQSNSRTFPETGKTVQGRFLTYWDTHGGLAQQGYPISNEMQERSDTDGKTYTVQYFERAVFELHTELQPPNDVLLSLLGVFLYNENYPNGAPGQQPNTSAGSQLFTETGKRVGGRFLEYWQARGGLAQQGYPISDEFIERSALDGNEYLVQYFERAVFELHPENLPPFDVLLSQLGTFRYRTLYPSGSTPSPVIPTPVAGCTSNLAPGVWSGPFDWSFTLTADNGLTGDGSLRADIALDVQCNGTFTGTANTTAYTAQATYAGVRAMTCSMTVPPVADFTGSVVAAPDGLHLAIPGGRWREGTVVCSGPLTAPYTLDLTGQPIDAADVRVETVSEGKISGSQWLADPALKIIRDQLALLMPGATVDITSQGHWELVHNPVNTP